MTYVLSLKVFVAVMVTLLSLWRMIQILRMTEGSIVEGQITYVEGKPGRGGSPLLTFSYSAEGQRLHKTWGETLDARSRHKLLDAVARYNIGDSVPVWYAKADPDVCCIGERVQPRDFIGNRFAQLSEGLIRLFR
ncbi:DUF3592 domain-containing protein [Pseudomonas batumici]|uniref:DUF3592 domain-containing protein n=1 Tax=Pseudomonas batumici TaxID=226910 RepID=UPI0030CC394B